MAPREAAPAEEGPRLRKEKTRTSANRAKLMVREERTWFNATWRPWTESKERRILERDGRTGSGVGDGAGRGLGLLGESRIRKTG